MLKSKIHRATVTDANLEYEGSITIDRNLLKHADIWPFERVEVYNITNGQRFATYAIEAPSGSGEICVNGAAAHLVSPGDLVIIASFVTMEEADLRSFAPKIVLVDKSNQQKSSATLVPEMGT